MKLSIVVLRSPVAMSQLRVAARLSEELKVQSEEPFVSPGKQIRRRATSARHRLSGSRSEGQLGRRTGMLHGVKQFSSHAYFTR